MSNPLQPTGLGADGAAAGGDEAEGARVLSARRELTRLADLWADRHSYSAGEQHGIQIAIEDYLMEEIMTDRNLSQQLQDGDPMTKIRRFSTGATRDTDEGKPRYAGFLSPLVLQAFGDYMHRHRQQQDGTLREADNWKKGMPNREYLESAFRHLHDWWLIDEGHAEEAREDLKEALCAVIFNAQGRLHNLMLGREE